MSQDRREFIKMVGATAAAVGTVAAVSSGTAQAQAARFKT